MLRQRIHEQYGDACRIQTVRRAPRFGASVFVLDLTRGARLLRLLGAINRDGIMTEQSAMDRLCPERLVFGYERLMLAAFAAVPEPRSALLLGLGGGAMCRHLEAYLPGCAVTVVERDRIVIDLAREYFHVRHQVLRADAETVVAGSRRSFDVILVDLYDANGAAQVAPGFWADCASALTRGGCLAVNWADFVGAERVRQETERIRSAFGRAFFLAERGDPSNLVQLAPTDRRFRLADLEPRMRRFARAHRLPAEDVNILKRSTLSPRYPGKRRADR